MTRFQAQPPGIPRMTDKILTTDANRWTELANHVLSGKQVDEAQALSILRSDDDELLKLMDAAYRVRKRILASKFSCIT